MARILLIDDDDAVRSMLSLTLTHFGHTVTEALNGAEGLKHFARDGTDLVITDLVMPEKEGLETIMELRRLQPQVKIIAMSGGGRNKGMDYLRPAKAMGAAITLAKPFSNERLIAAVNEVLAGSDPLAPLPVAT
jgi:DNA-binding response OmpR family regulator